MSLESHIAVFCDFGRNEEEQVMAIASLTQLLARKEASMQDMILAMGDVLTGSDDKLRARGTLLLADVTRDLSVGDPVGISSNSAQQLAKFFCARLSDFPSLLPAMKGLEVLVRYHAHRVVPPTDLVLPIEKAMSEINVQSLSQSLRSQAFKVYTALLIDSKDARLAMGGAESPVLAYNPHVEVLSASASLSGGASMEQDRNVQRMLDSVLCAVEGEKDPRGLLLSLRLIRAIQTYYPTFVYLFADRLFDMVACYFPITFTSSPNDPYQVSAEMLVMQLQDCLCGHYDFLDRLVPFLKDKLAHDSLVGRTHALSCLSRVCRDFGIDGIVAHHDSRAIADVVYDTVAGSRDTAESNQEAADLSTAALSTIEDIAAAATTPRSGSSKKFTASWGELPGHLLRRAVNALAAEQGSSASLAGKVALRVACALSRGSYLSAKAVVDLIFPVLLGHLKRSSLQDSSLPATIAQVTQMLLAVDTGLDLSVLGPLHPFLEHAKPVMSAVLSLIDAEASSYCISAAVCREALLCLKAVFSRFPLSAIGLSSEVMNSLIARVTDIAIKGSNALSAKCARIASSEFYIPLPAREETTDMEIDGHSHDHVGHNDSERGAGSGGCCGGNSYSHGGGGDGGGCCSSGSNSHGHDHSSDNHGDTLWDRRVIQMHELERQRASLTNSVDKASQQLAEAAIGLLATLARHVASSSDPLMISLAACCINPVSTLLSTTTLEASLNVLSSLGSAMAPTEVYGLCLEPIIRIISSSGERVVKESEFSMLFSSLQGTLTERQQQRATFLLSSPIYRTADLRNATASSSEVIDAINRLFVTCINVVKDEYKEKILQDLLSGVGAGFEELTKNGLGMRLLLSVVDSLPSTSSQLSDGSTLQSFVDYLTSHRGWTSKESLFTSGGKLVAVYINKLPSSTLECFEKTVSAMVQCTSILQEDPSSRPAASYLVHICRSILMKSNSSFDVSQSLPAEITRMIVSERDDCSQILSWHEIVARICTSALSNSLAVALEFSVLCEDSPTIWKNAVCTMFWKQRLWNLFHSRLEALVDVGPQFSLALLSLLMRMPNLVINDCKSLVCLLCIQTIAFSSDRGKQDDCVVSSLRYLAIELLELHFMVLSDMLVSHLTTLAPACVAIAQNAESGRDRRRSLNLLLLICSAYPFHRLYPVQSQVVRGLLEVLNDRKRAVRMLAAKARNEWSVIEKP